MLGCGCDSIIKKEKSTTWYQALNMNKSDKSVYTVYQCNQQSALCMKKKKKKIKKELIHQCREPLISQRFHPSLPI